MTPSKKGFYYVDDYPEEALDLRQDLVAMKDANGNPVTGAVSTLL